VKREQERERIKVTDGVSIYLRWKTWWIDVHGNGRRTKRSLGTTDRSEAIRRALEAEAAPAPQGKAAYESLKDAFARYLKDYADPALGHMREGTMKRYKQVVGMFVERVGPTLPPSKLTRQLLLEFQRERSKSVVADTVNGDVGYVKAFVNWCRAEGLVEHDPCFKVKRLKVNRSKRRTLSPDEFEEIEMAVRPSGGAMFGANAELAPMLHDYVILGANTGMRPNEILHVRGCDFDANRGLLEIKAWGEWQTKDAEDRTLQLNSAALAVLARRKLQNGDKELPLFCGREGCIRDWKNVYHELKKKLPPRLSWAGLYDLRHYFATEAAHQDWPVEKLRLYLGHADIATTLKYYVDVKAAQVGAPPVIALGMADRAP
jgi:integrase